MLTATAQANVLLLLWYYALMVFCSYVIMVLWYNVLGIRLLWYYALKVSKFSENSKNLSRKLLFQGKGKGKGCSDAHVGGQRHRQRQRKGLFICLSIVL